MFGYIKPFVPELRVRELEFYRAAYCGLCKRMGEECGSSSRLCLSYDLTFLSLLIMALTGENTKTEKLRCPANCASKKSMAVNSAATDYAACAAACLASCGFADDVRDERGMRRLFASIAGGISDKWVKKTEKLYPGLADGIESRLEALTKAETLAMCNNTDFNAEPASAPADRCSSLFGDVLAFICCFPFEGDDSFEGRSSRAIASAVGSAAGKWIYIIDALDDIKKDSEKGRFNPLLLTYGKDTLNDEEKTTLKCHLASLSGQALDAMMLCDSADGGRREPTAIVDNILSSGMRAVAAEVLEGTYHKTAKDKI